MPSSSVSSRASVTAAGGDAARGLRSSTPVFHRPNSSAACRSWPAQFGDQRDHAGVDAGHQPIGFLALVAACQQPPAPPGTSAMSAPR